MNRKRISLATALLLAVIAATVAIPELLEALPNGLLPPACLVSADSPRIGQPLVRRWCIPTAAGNGIALVLALGAVAALLTTTSGEA